MTSKLFNLIVFFKRQNKITRLVVTTALFLFLFVIMVPELLFYISSQNPKQLTIEEIMATPKGKLPGYILLKDAQPLRTVHTPVYQEIDSSASSNNSLANMFLMKANCYHYVLDKNETNKRTSCTPISYPVFSKNKIKKAAIASAAALTTFVVIRDELVKSEDLKNDHYFKDSGFLLQGKFDNDSIDEETLSLLKKSGYRVSKNAIVLQKGKLPVPIFHSVIYTALALSFAGIGLLSFFPVTTLQKYFTITTHTES